MNKKTNAIFLDRDGVLNKERKDYVKNVNELEIINEIETPLKLLKKKGYLLIVITNQSAINRGYTTHESVKKIHSKLNTYLEKFDVHIDKFYYCPHRPNENCYCRKPKPGLLLQAAKDFDIDLKNSWMIGASLTDTEAATSVGCKAILVKKNQTLVNIIKMLLDKDFK